MVTEPVVASFSVRGYDLAIVIIANFHAALGRLCMGYSICVD